MSLFKAVTGRSSTPPLCPGGRKRGQLIMESDFLNQSLELSLVLIPI